MRMHCANASTTTTPIAPAGLRTPTSPGAGKLVLEPRMRIATRKKPQIEESDIYPWMAGGPQATAFNVYVSATLGLDKRRMDDRDLFPFGQDVADMKLYARRTYALARFDERVASLQIQTFDYTGGAHEAISEASLNWDMARAKPFALDDVFVKDTSWRAFVTDFCIKVLHDGFAEQGAPDPDREAVESVVGDGDNWLWGPKAATVHFTVYAIASFAAGESDVAIPYDVLVPYLRTDAVVLPSDETVAVPLTGIGLATGSFLRSIRAQRSRVAPDAVRVLRHACAEHARRDSCAMSVSHSKTVLNSQHALASDRVCRGSGNRRGTVRKPCSVIDHDNAHRLSPFAPDRSQSDPLRRTQ